jgi:CubicO group peptidase (beta-lactamase class C family)
MDSRWGVGAGTGTSAEREKIAAPLLLTELSPEAPVSPRILAAPLLIAVLSACAPSAPPQAPVEVPAPAPTLNDSDLQALRDLVQGQVDGGEIAGAVALVATADEELMFETFGVRDLDSGEPMPRDAIFRIYSMTKPITSTAVMMLHERGHFELDDPVGVYLPELADVEVGVESTDDSGEPALITEPLARPITIRDLLRHTSGMTYGLFAQSMVDTMYLESLFEATDLADMVTRLSRLPLKHQPATVFEYGVSTDMLGRLVEVVSEQPFDEFLQENILEPLGMDDTAFWVSEDRRDRLAGYYLKANAGLTPMNLGDQFVTPPTMLSGGGGLVSTAADYLRFCRMILRGGELDGVRILQPDTVAAMGSDQLAGLPGLDGGPPGGTMVTGFGLGFALTPEAGPGAVPAGTLWWGGYASTSFWIDPTEGLIGIYMIQRQPFSPEMGGAFQAAVYGRLAAAESTVEH